MAHTIFFAILARFVLVLPYLALFNSMTFLWFLSQDYLPMSERKITHLEAVRDQIDSAIRSYFLWDDLVSATTLAGAAERVMSDMQAQDGIFGVDAASIRSITFT